MEVLGTDLGDVLGGLGGVRREPTTWVAFESNTQLEKSKPRRRKGLRGRATAEEMAMMLMAGGKASRREQDLRPEQIEALRLKREPKDLSITCLEQEDGEGNIEYKYRIKDPHPVRLQQLITQMKYRLSEGSGECFYYIGIEDNGYPKGLDPADLDASIATLHRMAASLGAAVTLLRHLPAAWGRRAALLRVATSTAAEARHTDLRIAVAGSADAGKSTLVAVLTHGSNSRPLLDNGRGLARMSVFRHKHEMQSGRTSSICHQLLGYDRQGRVINYATPAATVLTPAEISGSAAKVLTFLDLGGHEKYLKTALYGMTALLPDYGLLCVCAAAGLGGIAREHLAAALALEMPVAVVITKVETVKPERFAAALAEVRQLVALTVQHEGEGGPAGELSPADAERHVEAASPLVTTEAEAQASAGVLCHLHADSLASAAARGTLRVHMPVFAVSAVTGAGLPLLHAFLSALQPGSTLKRAVSVPLVPSPGLSNAGGGMEQGPRLAHAPSAPAISAGSSSSASAGVESSCGALSSGRSSEGGSPRAAPDVIGGSVFAFSALEAAEAKVTSFGHPQRLYAASAAAAQARGNGAVPSPSPDAESQAVHFQVDGTFEVEGVGYVLSGTLLGGVVRLGQQLALGPTASGGFARVTVRQLQRSHVAVQIVRAGQTATIAVSPVEISEDFHGNTAGLGLAVPAAVPGVGVVVDNGECSGFVSFADAVAALPLGFSPGALAGAGLVSAAAVAPSSAVAAMPTAAIGSRGGLGDDFGDALAAVQDALDLCLAGDSGDGVGTGCAADDDMFPFDASESPGASTAAAVPQSSASAAFSPRLSATQYEPYSRSVHSNGDIYGSDYGLSALQSLCQLHSTTSFSVRPSGRTAANRLGGTGLSASAPRRSMFMNAVQEAGSLVQQLCPLGSAMNACRKGAVLLEPALQPRTSWVFEAVLLLLGGHWPPRGLLCGCWPAAGEDEAEATVNALARRDGVAVSGLDLAGGAASERPAGRRLRQRSTVAGTYVTMVHCGSVRQQAQVLMMQELHDDRLGGAATDSNGHCTSGCDELRVSASTRAAAALLHSVRSQQPGSPTGPAAAQLQPADQDLGCLVQVVLRWQHRPEWLREGAKLLVGDRCDGRVAGAGFVRRVL